MTRDGFYIWNPEIAKSAYNKILVGLLLVGALAACLFRVWPLWMKFGVWYVSVALLVAIIGTAIIRYIVWYFLLIAGHSFWIFPNMWDDSKGILGCFMPIYSYEKNNDGT